MQVREHCFNLLITALEKNANSSPAPPPGEEPPISRLDEAAVAMEYGVFLSTRNMQVYKMNINKKVDCVGVCVCGGGGGGGG